MIEELDDPKFVMGGGAQLTPVERWEQLKAAQRAPDLVRAAPIELPDPTHPVSIDDISKWQGKVDFSIMRQKAQCVYIRAGFGDIGKDANLEANVTGAQAAGMPHGLYWYVKAGADFRKHVASFKQAWQQYAGQLPPVFDCEYTSYTKNVKGNTANWLTKLVKNWCDETDIDPMIYTRQTWWDANTSRTDWPKTLDLWIAHYTSVPEGTIINGKPVPWLPADWAAVVNPRTWSMWQYSADGNELGPSHGVESASIDRNRWNGTINQFNQKYGTHILPLGSVVQPPIEPPPPYFSTHVVTIQTCNPRTRPALGNATDAGAIIKGQIFEKAGEKQNGFQPVKIWLHETVIEDV